jgi:hypothetical protein
MRIVVLPFEPERKVDQSRQEAPGEREGHD